jgi:hypothetical protein
MHIAGAWCGGALGVGLWLACGQHRGRLSIMLQSLV